MVNNKINLYKKNRLHIKTYSYDSIKNPQHHVKQSITDSKVLGAGVPPMQTCILPILQHLLKKLVYYNTFQSILDDSIIAMYFIK